MYKYYNYCLRLETNKVLYNEKVLTIDLNTPINKLISHEELINANFRIVSCDFHYFGSSPYILRDNTVIWSVKLSDCTLNELLDTYTTCNLIITNEGGLGCVYIPEFIHNIYNIYSDYKEIIEFAYITGNFILGIFKVINKLNNFVASKGVKRKSIYDSTYLKDYWNLVEHSECFDLKKEESRNLLKYLGYKYNKSSQRYEVNHINKKHIKKVMEKKKYKEPPL